MYSMRTQVLRKLFLVPTPWCPPLIAYLPRLSVLPREKILHDIFRPVGIQILHLMWPKTIYLCVPHLSYNYGFISVLCQNKLFMSYVLLHPCWLRQANRVPAMHREKKDQANERDVAFAAMLARQGVVGYNHK